MRSLLIATFALFVIALGLTAALADAGPQTTYLAQTSIGLFFIIVAVVLVTSMTTWIYIALFTFVGPIVLVVSVTTWLQLLLSKLFGERFARRKIHRFLGWKLLRSQRKMVSPPSVVAQSWYALLTRRARTSVVLAFIGGAAIIANVLIGSPSTFNAISEAVGPGFALALRVGLIGVGVVFLLIGMLRLMLRPPERAPVPVIWERNAVTLPTFISIVGVAIGIWALIVVLGVMHGLQSDLRDKILRTNAHVVIEPKDPDGSLGDALALEHEARALPGVAEAYAYVYGEVMVASPTGIGVNVIIKGMSAEALEHSEQLAGFMEQGSVAWLERPETLIPDRYRFPFERRSLLPDDDGAAAPGGDEGLKNTLGATPPVDGGADDAIPSLPALAGEPLRSRPSLYPGILVGAELARSLGVDIGNEIQLISPDGEVGPSGLRPKLRSFRVAGVFRTGMYEYDQKLAYVLDDEAQRFFDYGSDLNRLEMRLHDPEESSAVVAALGAITQARYPGVVVSDWRERNKTLFSALQLERVVMLIILAFIIIVAALLIVSSLVMLVVEKVKEIAILKALGASDFSIVRAFMVVGSFIGVFGALAGIPLGVGTCLWLTSEGFALPREFYISSLPVRLDAIEVVMIGLAALAVCLLATLYPSYRASRLRPADGLRHG